MACALRKQAGGDIAANLSPDLVALVADGDLLDFVSHWIRADIPDRAPVASAMGVQQQLIAQQTQLTTLMANQQAATAAAAVPRLKTVAEVYPAFVGSLLKYCHVEREELLPPLYSQMANSKRHEQVAIVEYALSARADEIGWAPPVASPKVVQMIYKMQFTAPDMDDITSGLSMFLMGGANEFKAGGVRVRQNVFTMVNASNVAPNMDQLNRLVDNAPQMAHDLVSLLTMLRAYSILLDVMLGPHHILLASYRAFVLRWDQQTQPTLNSCFSMAKIPVLMPLVQRWLQLEMQYWFNQVPMVADRILPPAPDFPAILRDVALHLWNTFQAIPTRYTVTPPALLPALTMPNEGVFPPVIAPPPAAPAPATPRRPTLNAVTNPNPNSTLIARYGWYGGRLRVLTAQLPVSSRRPMEAAPNYVSPAASLATATPTVIVEILTDHSLPPKKAASLPSSRQGMSNRGHGGPQCVGWLRYRPQPTNGSPRHTKAPPLPYGNQLRQNRRR